MILVQNGCIKIVADSILCDNADLFIVVLMFNESRDLLRHQERWIAFFHGSHMSYFCIYFLGVGDHNYCRNPDSSDRPWCYIVGPDGEVQRQSCSIDTCKGSIKSIFCVNCMMMEVVFMAAVK